MGSWVRAGTAATVLALLSGATAGAQETREPSQWPFTASSPWNSPLGTGAKYEDQVCDGLIRSEATKNSALGQKIPWINAEEYSFPVFRATDADPLTPFYKGEDPHLTAPNGSVAGQVRLPSAAAPAAGSDRSMVVIEPDGESSAESWLTHVNPGFVNTGHFHREDLVDDDGFAPEGGTGIRAAKASVLGGLIRTREMQLERIVDRKERTGWIRHALAIALPQSLMAPRYVDPATGVDGDTNGYTGAIPMGQLLAIPPSVDIKAMLPPDKSPLLGHKPRQLSDAGLALATALQTYGAYVVDTAGATVLFAEPTAAALVHPARNHYDGENHSELKTILAHMSCVSNNTRPNWGGGGEPLAPPPPPFG